MTFVYTFVILAGFWVLLSGKFDLFHLSLGALCCLLVSLMSADLLFEKKATKSGLAAAWRFALYLPWLMWEIVKANLHVARLALHPRMDALIEPQVIRVKSDLKQDIAKVALANSITLTPGTITIHVEGGDLIVHAISCKAAGDLPADAASAMVRRVARVFGEA